MLWNAADAGRRIVRGRCASLSFLASYIGMFLLELINIIL